MNFIKSKLRVVIADTPWVVKNRPEATGAIFLTGYLIGYLVAAI